MVDASWFGPTGIGRFAEEVLRRAPTGIDLVEIRRGKPNASMLSPLLLGAEYWTSPRPRPKAFWSPGFIPPVMPGSAWKSVTVHDLTHRHYYSAKHAAFYSVVMKPLFRQMDLLFTVSEFSRREIVEWTGVPESRVVAIPHGIDSSFSAIGGRLDFGRPYILYVGNRRPYKNVPRLLRAFARSGLAARGFMLALSGGADWELDQLATSLGIAQDLRYLGLIPEADLPAAYRGAHAVSFVSLYEGFGFPILEGMGCGTPVLTSALSSMPEVAGGAALLVDDPQDDEQVADGLVAICTDDVLRARLRTAGLERVRAFDWNSCAQAYWERIQSHC